ncbi:flagellar assembly protein FliH [Azoarcus sp. L1K30]|uniref:flagellar assembly protein FliH n=1 Tax=Azoarcus sp. L1K30 TaxID=2820277 RepID=UPI001B838321|nr:flagellar assembly protein FliH [Azoarcus sp. L1K30]MBR0564531.1 flagellar assembly protein FliH [Azoarcus sp. L1K30]
MSISRHQAVGAYRRWEPTAFDADPAARPAPPDARTEPTPEAVVDTPPEQAPEPSLPEGFHFPTADEIERMHEDARSAGHAEGFAEGHSAGQKAGYDAGYAEGKARAEAEAARLRELADELDQAMERIDDEVADELLALSIEIARQVLQHTLAAHPDRVLDTIRAALQQLPQTHAQIRLHPDDLALAREQLGEQVGHGNHRLVEDATIARGGCRVEASGAQIDATMETRWRRVLESLGKEDAEWTPPEAE